MSDFDAIVVGSGMSGGWVAKELCERGFKVALIERGRKTEPAKDYTDMPDPWQRRDLDWVPRHELAERYPVQGAISQMAQSTKHWWVRDDEHPYVTDEDKPFEWYRGYHLGGRSIMWARMSYRFSEMDFQANARDGHGIPWPVGYDEIAPWYDHAERFVGIAGNDDGLDQLPSGGNYLPAFEPSCAEAEFKRGLEATYPGRNLIIGRVANLSRPTSTQLELGRGQCQVRNRCHHGCSFGAYFSSVSATIPAAERTGNLTIIADAIVERVLTNERGDLATGVAYVDANTKERKTVTGRTVFLNASAINSALIMLQSASDAHPNGLANGSGQVGRNLMDHIAGAWVEGRVPGHLDKYYHGNRPITAYLPRYQNLDGKTHDFDRGFAYQVYSWREDWQHMRDRQGVGGDYKGRIREPGPWKLVLDAYAEVLPYERNHVRPHPTKTDRWGVPVPYIDAVFGENETKLMLAAYDDAFEMMERLGLEDIKAKPRSEIRPTSPGNRIHEMGTIRMGNDPAKAPLNRWNQAHEVSNLFNTDGGFMCSSAVQNPSLTYMAFSARAANRAADLMQQGTI